MSNVAHLVIIEDTDGELEDIHYYCSDYCAQSDNGYGGWNGANELESCEPCESCGALIEGYAHGDDDVDSYCRGR